MKFYLSIILILLFSSNLFADNSDDSSIKIELPSMKFRGELNLILLPQFNYLKGVSSNHISPVTSNILDYSDEYDNHHDADDPGRIIGSNELEIQMQLGFIYSFIFPLYLSKHPIVEDANITFNLLFNITPITFEGGGELNFTPFPFLFFTAGISLGTGWNIDGLPTGLARNNYGGQIKNKPKDILIGDSFYGALMQNWFSITMQIDLAEIFDNNKHKRWLHIIGMVKPQFVNTILLNYLYHDRPFEWKTETTLNGWTFISSFFAGYSIPIIDDPKVKEAEKKRFIGGMKSRNLSVTAGMSAELSIDISHFNDSKISKNGWGSDFARVLFGPMLIFDLPCNISAMLGLNWTNGISYTSDTVGNADFAKRKYDDWYVALDSIFICIGWKF